MNESWRVCSNHTEDCPNSHLDSVRWLMLPLSGLIVVGNLLIIVGILANRRLHTTTNWFFLSLVFSDLATGIALPSLPTMSLKRPLAPRFFCFFAHLFPNFTVLSLLANLVLVHGDRYLYIARPLRHRGWLRRRAPAAILAVWLLPLLFASLPLLGWNGWPRQEGEEEMCCCPFSHVFTQEYIYLEVYGLLMPSILITCTLNACLLRLARRQMRDIRRQYRAVRGARSEEGAAGSTEEGASRMKRAQERGGDPTSALEHRLNLKYARSVTGFLLIFLVCWLPYIVHLHARFLLPDRGLRTHIILSCLGVSSAALVPFALALGNREYLRVWRRVCSRARRRLGEGLAAFPMQQIGGSRTPPVPTPHTGVG
ncbi:G-protein coupled bile acid receptor 1 [Hypanus sabinus]|uniref:G-protein coupled bile acid receptor 1 n=1 Tax=Hypanus sabinus TaxID=79690 RepID=UPI0028C42BCF|nr:G-protein coupled bile acid receptor 1 [Hypanus sabinus]